MPEKKIKNVRLYFQMRRGRIMYYFLVEDDPKKNQEPVSWQEFIKQWDNSSKIYVQVSDSKENMSYYRARLVINYEKSQELQNNHDYSIFRNAEELFCTECRQYKRLLVICDPEMALKISFNLFNKKYNTFIIEKNMSNRINSFQELENRIKKKNINNYYEILL